MSIDKLKEMGFNLIPLKPKSKEPIGGLNWKQFQENKYTGSYPDSCNVAVICGTSSGNIFVVDLDDTTLYDDYPEEIKNTFTVKTGKGYHIYYHFHGFPPPNKKLDDKRGRHIDIKSHGGYVLAPTSVHPNGSIYTAINESPIMDISIQKLKEHLSNMGFNVETKPVEEIEGGISEGGRNDATFKYACYLIRDKGLFGEALKLEIDNLNQKHTPPLPESEVSLIISQAEKAEHKNMTKHIVDARSVVEKLSNAPLKLTMQDITPTYENKPIEFDCMITAVGERMTYTVSADCSCVMCGSSKKVFCDDLHILQVPFCMKDKRPYDIDESTKVTAYIQHMRIQEFLETARNATPIEFDAEITDEDVGEAFIGDRKTVVARFRSIPKPKSAYNDIVFQITHMKDLEQKAGCMPSQQEIEKWQKINIFERVTASIAPDIYINPRIVESLILWACGGNSLNGKRDLIHCGILGDAQLGKSDLLLKMYKLLPGSGYTVGRNTSGAGLTIAMVKLYNGTMIPKAGFFPQHTGHPCIIDEIDKMKKEDHNSCLEVMEQQTTSQAKAGTGGGLTLPTKCPLLIAGNPKNGKFNSKYPTVMDNFEMETPFVSRFDILWLLVDDNDPESDKLIRKFIRSYQSRKQDYMTVEELQRYFEYIRSLDATVPDELMDRIDELHTKMRPLNVDSGVPIGWRQYHGLYRLLTASAKANLRSVVCEEDFDIVENIIKESYKSMKMNLDTGKSSDTHKKTKDTKKETILLTWGECMDEQLDNSVDKQEFINTLAKKDGFNALDAPTVFSRMLEAGDLIMDNETERYKKVR